VRAEDLVLVAVLSGADTVESIAEATRLDMASVERAVQKLVAEGMLAYEERGFWIFRRHVLRLTERGFERAQKALEELKKVAEHIRSRLVEARDEELHTLLRPYASIIPLMVYLGLLDMAFLTLPLAIGFEDAEELAEDADVDIENADVDFV